MDKIEKYKNIIQEEFDYQKTIKIANAPDIKRHLIVNKDRTDFLLLDIGFQGKSYSHYPVFHVAIEKGQVIIYQDNTDIALVNILMDAGIEKSDIVLGYLAKLSQKYSPYAVAA